MDDIYSVSWHACCSYLAEAMHWKWPTERMKVWVLLLDWWWIALQPTQSHVAVPNPWELYIRRSEASCKWPLCMSQVLFIEWGYYLIRPEVPWEKFHPDIAANAGLWFWLPGVVPCSILCNMLRGEGIFSYICTEERSSDVSCCWSMMGKNVLANVPVQSDQI